MDSSWGGRPPDVEPTRPGSVFTLPGCMQYAAYAARFLHLVAQQLHNPNRDNAEAVRFVLTTQGAVQSLVRLLLWLSKPTTATATASGVLAEALPAVQLMAVVGEVREGLAAAGGSGRTARMGAGRNGAAAAAAAAHGGTFPA